MRMQDRFIDPPPEGSINVYLTLTSREGKLCTVPAFLTIVGREVYGASLDPDAEEPYVAAQSFIGECHAIAEPVTQRYVHYKVWRSHPTEEANEIFADRDIGQPMSVNTSGVVPVPIKLPWWDIGTLFSKNYFA